MLVQQPLLQQRYRVFYYLYYNALIIDYKFKEFVGAV